MQQTKLSDIIIQIERIAEQLKEAVEAPPLELPRQSKKGVKYTKSKGAVRRTCLYLPLDLVDMMRQEGSKSNRTITDIVITALVKYLMFDKNGDKGGNC